MISKEQHIFSTDRMSGADYHNTYADLAEKVKLEDARETAFKEMDEHSTKGWIALGVGAACLPVNPIASTLILLESLRQINTFRETRKRRGEIIARMSYLQKRIEESTFISVDYLQVPCRN